MTDPLSTLRNSYMKDDDIFMRETDVIIGELSWPKDVKTNYLMWGSGKDGGPKEYYTLGCLVFFLKKLAFPHSMYVRQAAAENIPVVRRPDRKELLAFLSGETSASASTSGAGNASIDRSAPPAHCPPKRVVKRPADDDHAHSAGGVSALEPKRRRVMDNAVAVGGVAARRVSERLAARLDAHPRDAFVTLDNIKSLSEAMSVEKIAAIKAKRLAKKRTSIKGSDDVGGGGGGCAGGVDAREALDLDVDLTKAIEAKERQWRTRATILQSTGKSFAKSIFAILHSIKAREQGKAPAVARRPAPPAAPTGFPVASSSGGPGTYNRYDQERFIQQKKETEGFKIDTMGTYHGMTLESVTCGRTPRRPGASTPSTPTRRAASAHAPAPPPAPDEAGGLLPAILKRVSRTPIIIIPAANSSLISMYNAKDILQDLRFVSTEERKAGGGRQDSEVLLQRRKEVGLTVPYRVVDNPRKLTPNEWERVVAVFVMGPAWQFKGWPWDGSPVHIFSRICAFHLKYDEIRLDPNVAKWAVHVIELSRTKRHLDRAALKVFWENLDKHMIKFKPHLRF